MIVSALGWSYNMKVFNMNAQCPMLCRVHWVPYHSKYLSVVAYRIVMHELIIIPLNFYKTGCVFGPHQNISFG